MKRKKLWTGLASVTSAMLVVSGVGLQTLEYYSGTVNQALGIVTSEVVNNGDSAEDTEYYKSEYGEKNAENLQKLLTDAKAEAEAEEAEGAVLLRNENNALPLSENEKRVTLFGHATAQPLYKSKSAGSNGYKSDQVVDLYTALTNAGFAINDTMYEAYKNDESTARGTGGFDFQTQTTSVLSLGEESIDFYTEDIQKSWEDDYQDAAIVMLAREGGEGLELAQSDEMEGISQLALHQQEKDMLQMIKDSGKFKKIIVLINSGNPMELGWLEEYGVDACLWIGEPGQQGFNAVAKILDGEVNPSGRLTDTYAYSSLSAPALVNGSFNNQTWANLDEVTSAINLDAAGISNSTVQAEGIYIGYKYYETRYEDTVLKQGNADAAVGSIDGKEWNYTEEVQYPFGYGLSYSAFDQKLDKVTDNGDTLTAEVTVTNTGDVPGKCVVQLYAQTPYGNYEKENLVEKSAIQLANFGKTQQLAPGESETVEISVDKYLLASYDYTNAKGYIMSEGDYYLAIGDNAHDALNNVLAAKGAKGMVGTDGETVKGDKKNTFNWTEKFDAATYKNSQYTGAEVTNLFDDANPNNWEEGTVTYMSRNDWEGTYPQEATQLTLGAEQIKQLASEYVKPEGSESVSAYTQGENQSIPLAAMIGKTYDDEAWETYLNQFTIEELTSLVADNFGTSEIISVGKPAVVVGDGMDGIGATFNEDLYGTDECDIAFPTEIVLASTFNKELMTNRGNLMAEEALYAGMENVWMPGINLHRTPFGGRSFEYYSEDANMNYLCSINTVEAMEAKGVHAGAKHLIGNDQENNREGIAVLFNEQAFREGALRGVEGCIAVGKAQSVMHSLNRVGLVWSSANKVLCTDVLQTEWGFNGQQETDAVAGAVGTYKFQFEKALEAGTDQFCLDFSGESANALAASITKNDDGYLLGKMRESAHQYLYTVVNSNAMNGDSQNSTIKTYTPWWRTLMTCAIAAFAVLEVLFLFLLYRKEKETIKVEVNKS